jgi:hypothetical protein
LGRVSRQSQAVSAGSHIRARPDFKDYCVQNLVCQGQECFCGRNKAHGLAAIRSAYDDTGLASFGCSLPHCGAERVALRLRLQNLGRREEGWSHRINGPSVLVRSNNPNVGRSNRPSQPPGRKSLKVGENCRTIREHWARRISFRLERDCQKEVQSALLLRQCEKGLRTQFGTRRMQKREPLIHFKRDLCFLKLTGKSNLKVRKSYSSGSQFSLATSGSTIQSCFFI